MMKRSEKIRLILEQALNPVDLEIVDESDLHAGHAGAREGGESHYKITIVSAEFIGLSRLDRERRVHSLLAGEFADGLHAASIRARPPDEAR